MPTGSIDLIEPTLRLRGDFYSLAEEFVAEGDDRYREAIADFEAFIRLCTDETVGRNLAFGRVPQSTFWFYITIRGFSLVPDYGIRSMHISKKRPDRSAMTSVLLKDAEVMVPRFCD
jgi:hypothetical protein